MTDSAALNAALEVVATGGLKAREEAISRLLDERLSTLVSFCLARIGEGNFRLRNAAIEVLGRAGPKTLVELRPRLAAGSSELKMFVAPVLADFHDSRAVTLLHEWLEDEDPNLVATSCEALGKLGDPRSVGPLARLVGDNPWLAGPALMALGHLGQPEALSVMLTALAQEELEAFAVGALGLLGLPEGWPHIAEAVRREPSLATIALEHLRAIFERIGPEAIRQAAKPESLWLAAARTALGREDSRYAAVRILGALGDVDSIPRLCDLYLKRGEDESIPSELARMPQSVEYIRSLLNHELSDEESRRLVRLVFMTIPDAGELAPHFLAHPSAAVRLEMVLFLGARGRRHIGPLVGLLADPEALVRRSALQTVKVLWRDAALASEIAGELDLESIPGDTLEAMAREAPEPIPERIARFLEEQAARGDAGAAAGDDGSLRTLLEARRTPERVLRRLRQSSGVSVWDLPTLEMLAALPDAEAPELLLRAALEASEGLRFVAAEALAQHPAATMKHQQILLGKARDAGTMAAALAWAQRRPSPEAGTAVAAVRPLRDPYVEATHLRAWAATAPAAAAAAAGNALRHTSWYVQLAAWQAVLQGGEAAEVSVESLHPLTQEVLQALQ